MADLEALDSQLLVLAAGHTDIARRPHNEDAVLVRPDLDLYVLADGAGGENAGNVASALATTSVAHWFEGTQAGAGDGSPAFDELGLPWPARRLSTAIHRANAEVVEVSKSSERHQGMGTTVVAAHFTNGGNVLHLAHVGDSRCYRLRAGILEQLTNDHSLANDVLEMRPDLPSIEAARLPRNVITRALGMSDTVRVSVRSYNVASGDLYLLCSDGLTDVLDEAQIVEALELVKVPEEQVRLLVDLAKSNGGDDNIAAVVISCKAPSGLIAKAGRVPLRVRPQPQRASVPAATGPEGSSPEIIVIGPESEDDGSSPIHVVPRESSNAKLVTTMQGFLGPMRPGRKRPPARPRSGDTTLLCSACGGSMPPESAQCPHCGVTI